MPPRKQSPAGATGPPAPLGPRHPRPLLGATPNDPETGFAACWGRLVVAWHLPSNPHNSLEVTIEDLQAAALQLFSAGVVHHAAVARRLVDELAKAPESAFDNWHWPEM